MTLAVGIVVIGRDEGERLKRCLHSMVGGDRPVVYVDSGSRDGSVEFASGLGVQVVALDLSTPFTMARARNAGFEALVGAAPETEAVHFFDGDCEVEDGWIERATAYMTDSAACAAVTGFRHERYPEASVWNRIINVEWRGPTGVIAACGGDALIRRSAFEAVGGFRPDMIAGEEPELCVRMRLAGHEIVRLDAPMTLHDADMQRFSQWWLRAQRAGHAYAEGAALQGKSRFRHNVHAVRSIAAWGIALPAVWLTAAAFSAALAPVFLPWVFWALPALLALQTLRVAAGMRQTLPDPGERWPYALSCVFAKFPQAQGLLRYWRGRDRPRTLIEYKDR